MRKLRLGILPEYPAHPRKMKGSNWQLERREIFIPRELDISDFMPKFDFSIFSTQLKHVKILKIKNKQIDIIKIYGNAKSFSLHVINCIQFRKF